MEDKLEELCKFRIEDRVRSIDPDYELVEGVIEDFYVFSESVYYTVVGVEYIFNEKFLEKI